MRNSSDTLPRVQDSCEDGIDETDAALVHALQIAPRASWTLVGRVLDIHPVTAARRWQRLRDAGLAWVTAYPGCRDVGGVSMGFVDVDCDSSQRNRLAGVLAQDPRVASVAMIGSGRDLLLTVYIGDVRSLSSFVLDEVGVLDGVHATRLHVSTVLFGEGSRWRFGALTPHQQRSLNDARGTAKSRPGFSAEQRELMLALAPDARRSAAHLAELVGTSPSTVTRRIRTMVETGQLSLRCEVAQCLGWPVTANYWGQVPASELERTAHALTAMPEVRLCVGTTGSSNLLITAWLRTATGMQRLERALTERCPEVQLSERALTLRTSKRMGWLLDERGRALECRPIDPWARPVPSAGPAGSTMDEPVGIAGSGPAGGTLAGSAPAGNGSMTMARNA